MQRVRSAFGAFSVVSQVESENRAPFPGSGGGWFIESIISALLIVLVVRRTHFSDDYLWLPFVTCRRVARLKARITSSLYSNRASNRLPLRPISMRCFPAIASAWRASCSTPNSSARKGGSAAFEAPGPVRDVPKRADLVGILL